MKKREEEKKRKKISHPNKHLVCKKKRILR